MPDSSRSSTSTTTTLERDVWPVAIDTWRGRTAKALATAPRTASLAAPSTGGAFTATTSWSSPYRPPTLAREAPGFTRTGTRICAMGRFWLREHLDGQRC